MFKVNNKDTRTTPYFTPCSSVSIVNFEHVIAGWVVLCAFYPIISHRGDINPLNATGFFLYPLKTSEHLWYFYFIQAFNISLRINLSSKKHGQIVGLIPNLNLLISVLETFLYDARHQHKQKKTSIGEKCLKDFCLIQIKLVDFSKMKDSPLLADSLMKSKRTKKSILNSIFNLLMFSDILDIAMIAQRLETEMQKRNMLKVNNISKKCLKYVHVNNKTLERRHWRHSGVFINFEHISHLCFNISGHVHKYETQFWGFVQTDPLLSFWQYLGTEKQASHKSRFIISPIFLIFRMLRSRQKMLNRKHYGHVFVRDILC